MARLIHIFLIVCLAGLMTGKAALAADKSGDKSAQTPVLVELFTSQGCSSCVPANKFLARLSEDPNVVALSFAVDYWDYLGWKDTYAKDSFTQRQYDYTHALHERRPYTPQIVLNGQIGMTGTQEAQVEGAIYGMLMVPTHGPQMQLRRDGETLLARVGAGKAPAGRADVYLATYLPGINKVAVAAGENEGKTLEQVNMVTNWQKLGKWNGQTVNFSVPTPEKGVTVLVLQNSGPGKVLGVARETIAPTSTAAIAPKTN